MVSFALGKKIEKDVFSLIRSARQKKYSESPRGIEPQTFGFRAPMHSFVIKFMHNSGASITDVILKVT